MVKIIWSDLAIDDLKTIYDYISKDSPAYADEMINRLIDRIGQLENFPKSGRVVPEFNQDHIRELILGNYRKVYLIDEKSVSISRVHHSAKNIP